MARFMAACQVCTELACHLHATCVTAFFAEPRDGFPEPRDLIDIVAYAGPDERVEFRLLRSGREQRVTATTAERELAEGESDGAEMAERLGVPEEQVAQAFEFGNQPFDLGG